MIAAPASALGASIAGSFTTETQRAPSLPRATPPVTDHPALPHHHEDTKNTKGTMKKDNKDKKAVVGVSFAVLRVLRAFVVDP
jgi:hypothetical protein